MKNSKLLRYNLQYFAEGGNGENPDGNNGNSTSQNATNGNGAANTSSKEENANSAQEKTFTQAEVDKIVKERLKREREKMQKALAGDEGQPQQQQTEGNPEGATAAVTAQLELANQRLIQATGMTEAVKLGVDPKYTAHVIKLADFSKIVVGEDGTVDASAVAKAIEAVLKEVPMFKTTVETAGGFKVGGEGQQQPNTNGWVTNQQTNQNVKPWNRVNRIR